MASIVGARQVVDVAAEDVEGDAEEENKLNYWSLFNLYLEKRLKILSLFNQGY